MKIFIGVTDTAGLLTEYAKGFRALGHEVTTLCKRQESFYKADYSINLSSISRFIDMDKIKSRFLLRILDAFERKLSELSLYLLFPFLLRKYDIFIFIWGKASLLSKNRDYSIIKKKGKKLICTFVGSDVRHIAAFYQEYGGDLITWEKVFHREDINTKMETLRIGELHSDLILSVPDQAGLAVRPYMHLHLPFDISQCQYKIPSRDEPVIIHAPSRRGIKGTDKIIATIHQLKSEGVKFTFKIMEGMSNALVLQELSDADIVIDELYLHGPGKLGLEAMSSGCALATHHLEGACKNFNPPLCNISPDNLYHQLKKIITDKQYRVELAENGRKFVEDHNIPELVAKNILSSLYNTQLSYDYYPEFYLKKFNPENNPINDEIKQKTLEAICKHGVNKDVKIEEAILKGLLSPMSSDKMAKIKRWVS